MTVHQRGLKYLSGLTVIADNVPGVLAPLHHHRRGDRVRRREGRPAQGSCYLFARRSEPSIPIGTRALSAQERVPDSIKALLVI